MKTLITIIAAAGICYSVTHRDAFSGLFPNSAQVRSDQLADQAKLEDWRADLAEAKHSFDVHQSQVGNPPIGGGVSFDLTLKLIDRAGDNSEADAKQIIALLQKKPLGLPLSQSEAALRERMEAYIAHRREGRPSARR